MKKLSYLMIALMCAMFVGCSSCQKEEKKDAIVVNGPLKFNAALEAINLAVLAEYPSAQFYEAQGQLVPRDIVDAPVVDGTIDKSQFLVAYNFIDVDKQKTIIGHFSNDTIKVDVVDDIWCEDIVTTPYVPMTAEDAINFICKELGDSALQAGPITLRHQLYPGEAEPRYFIGSLANLHTINVYTGKIDVPAGQ